MQVTDSQTAINICIIAIIAKKVSKNNIFRYQLWWYNWQSLYPRQRAFKSSDRRKLSRTSSRIPIALAEKIVFLRSLGKEKINIKKYLINEGIQPPTDNQIKYFNKSVTIDNNKNFSMNKFKKWCEERSIIPEDEYQVFVVKFEYLTTPQQEFLIFLTMKWLIKLAEKVNTYWVSSGFSIWNYQ